MKRKESATMIPHEVHEKSNLCAQERSLPKNKPMPPILVVDDDPVGRDGFAWLLRDAGFEVQEASTGEEALRLAAERSPRLVVLDVMLPDVEGYEVCRRLKTNPATASTLVLLVSGLGLRAENRVVGLEGGADGYLGKPVDPTELVAQVRALLRLQEALAAVKTLRGLLPICAWCKRIRSDEGYWKQMEAYLKAHLDVTFTHGMCPSCFADRQPSEANDLLAKLAGDAVPSTG
jgi:CheY-like chemotaxis protein